MTANQLGRSIFLASIFSLLTACGGGGSAQQSTSVTGPISEAKAGLTYQESAAPKSVCPTGGAKIDSGLDSNGNGVLDASEITNTQYVCNGLNGETTLFSSVVEASGSNCSNGGYRLNAGLDSNGDGILQASEVTSTAFACNGAPGTDGVNGTNGANGKTSLIAIAPESAGANCAFGGSKVTSGLDGNRDGILESGEVTSTGYVCNGTNFEVSIPAGCTVSNAPLHWPPFNGVSITSTDPDPSSDTQIHVGSLVTLHPNVIDTNSCPGNVIAENASWTLVSSPIGSGAVRNSLLPDLQFVPDKVGTYQYEVVATNSLGLSSPPYFVSVVTSTCGASPLTVVAQADGFSSPAGTDFAHSIVVVPSSSNGITATAVTQDNQNNPSLSGYCPARFTATVTYNWSVINSPSGANGQLTNLLGFNTAYMVGTVPGYYQIQVIAHDSNGMTSSPSVVYFQLPVPVVVTPP